MANFTENTHPLWLIENEGVWNREVIIGSKEVTHFSKEILNMCNMHNIIMCNGLEQWNGLELWKPHVTHIMVKVYWTTK